MRHPRLLNNHPPIVDNMVNDLCIVDIVTQGMANHNLDMVPTAASSSWLSLSSSLPHHHLLERIRDGVHCGSDGIKPVAQGEMARAKSSTSVCGRWVRFISCLSEEEGFNGTIIIKKDNLKVPHRLLFLHV